jgi:hypothetical protein
VADGAGTAVPLPLVDTASADRIWNGVPHLVAPLQERLQRAAGCLDGYGEVLSAHRADIALDGLQRREGERYWSALDRHDPLWLERVYAQLAPESDKHLADLDA